MKSVSKKFLIYHFKESDEDNTPREEQRAGPLTVPQLVRKKIITALIYNFPPLTHTAKLNYCHSLCPSIILFRDPPIHFLSSDLILTSVLFFLNNITLTLLLVVVLCVYGYILIYVTFFFWLLKTVYRQPCYKLPSSLISHVVLCTQSLLYTATSQCTRVHRCLHVSSVSLLPPLMPQ